MVGRHGRLGKVLDLIPHDRDSTLVTSVEFENARAEELGAEQLLAEGKDGRRLSGTGRAIEEHVRKLCKCRRWSALLCVEHSGPATSESTYVRIAQSLLEHLNGVVLSADFLEVLGTAVGSGGRSA